MLLLLRPQGESGSPVALTLSGNEITDAVRITATSGDGLAAEGSVGIWEATTNLVSNGGFETNTTGVTSVSSTPTRVTSEAKFGTASCQVVTGNAAANEGFYETFTATVAVYAVSAWVKGASGTVRVAVRDNSGANPQTGTAVTLNGTWQRATLVTTNLTAATWRAYVETDVQQNITYYVDGLQAELQPLATPYVETNGGTASRSAGRVRVTVGSVIDEPQSWVAIRLAPGWASTADIYAGGFPALFNWYDNGSNEVAVQYDVANDRFRIIRRNAGSNDNIFTSAQTFAVREAQTVIAAWTASAVKISAAGAAFASTAGSNVPTLAASEFDVGSAAAGASGWLDGDVAWFACGLGTLTDSDAAAIHANGTSDPSPGLFPGAAQLKLIWKANDATARSY